MTLSLCVLPCQMVRTRTFGGTNGGCVKRSNRVADWSWGGWDKISDRIRVDRMCPSSHEVCCVWVWTTVTPFPLITVMRCSLAWQQTSEAASLCYVLLSASSLREVQCTCHVAQAAMLDNAQQLSVRTIFRCRKVQGTNLNERCSKTLALLGSKFVRTPWGVSWVSDPSQLTPKSTANWPPLN